MSVPYEMLLHPELLTNEKLIQIIQERHLRVQNLVRMSRPELLELFHQFCVPHGQRKYKDSGRGKMLNKVRQASSSSTMTFNTINSRSLNNSRLSCTEEMMTSNINRPSCTEKMMNLNSNINNRKSRLNEDCLKPAFDALSGHIKRITLDKKPLPPKVNDSKRKLSIDTITLSSDCPAPKKERQQITWP